MVVIEDYIRQNETFRDALLKQDGGFMKYLAEYLPDHPEAYINTKLLRQYREHYSIQITRGNSTKYKLFHIQIYGICLDGKPQVLLS